MKSHRRDEFIEWIKGLLAVPFVLHANEQNHEELATFFTDPAEYERKIEENDLAIAIECQRRYLEIFGDVEKLVDHTIFLDTHENADPNVVSISRLRQLVPSIGLFFTRLPLSQAFLIEDLRKLISRRRLVSPSFNDVRSILNTAQVLALAKTYKNGDVAGSKLKLITFDGDVTLYDDGASLTDSSPVVSRLVMLLRKGLFVGIVTAAGYPSQQGAEMYYKRLKGLIDVIRETDLLTDDQRENLLVMGGESNYLFRYSHALRNFEFVEGDEWYLPIMKNWSKDKIAHIVDIIHNHLRHLRKKFCLDDDEKTTIIRKERSIGIIPVNGYKILREHLEEIVLSCSQKLTEILQKRLVGPLSNNEEQISVCAFNGGADVWVDIGDKSLGVESLQKYLCRDERVNHLCPILRSESLHIGDQFALVGANDFKARLSACTVWIANPRETVAILDDLLQEMDT